MQLITAIITAMLTVPALVTLGIRALCMHNPTVDNSIRNSNIYGNSNRVQHGDGHASCCGWTCVYVPSRVCEVQVELSQARGGHDSSVQCITVDQQYLYSADWHGCIKVRCSPASPLTSSQILIALHDTLLTHGQPLNSSHLLL